MTLRALLLPLVALCAACATVPNRGKMVMRDYAFPMRDLRYPSGLRVIVERDARAPTVTVVALVGAGSTSDPKGKEGLAHYVEHLTFRARPTGQGPVNQLLESAGAGETNAFTFFDETVYYARGGAGSLAELLRVEGERLTHPLENVEPAFADVEREVVRNELRQRNETGYVGQILGWTQEAVFGAHPYGRSIGGSLESVGGLTLAGARDFTHDHYRPDNMTLVVTGDVDLNVVDQLVTASLPAALREAAPGLKPAEHRLPTVAPPVVEPQGPREVHRRADVTRPELWIAWSLPRSFGDQSPMLEFVSRAAQSYLQMGGWQDEDVSGLSVELVGGVQGSLLFCRVELHTGEHLERSADKVLNELFNLGLSGSSSALGEVGFSKSRLSAVMGMAFLHENAVERASERARYTHFSGDPLFFSKTLQGVAKATSTEVANFASQYLTRERARIVYVTPLPGAATTQAGRVGVGGTLPGVAEAQYPLQPLARLRSSTPTPELAAATRFTLENGVQVIVVPRPGVPVVRVEVAMHGGSAAAQMAGADWLGWSLGRPRKSFNGQPYDIGAREGRQAAPDLYRYRLEGASGNLANLLAMAAERMGSTYLEAGLYEYFHREWLQHRARSPELPEEQARRELLQALYGSHPYGRGFRWASLVDVPESAISEWISRIHRPANATVVISGDVTAADAEQLSRQWLTQWSGSGARETVPSASLSLAVAPVPVKVLVTPRPNAVQGELTLACRLRSDDERARARGDLLSLILSDRLQRVLREKLGVSYGLHGHAHLLEGAGMMEISGAVENGALNAAFGVLQQTLASLRTEPVSLAELNRDKWALARQYAVRMSEPDALVDALLEVEKRNLPLAAVDHYPEHLVQLSAEDLRQGFDECARAGWVLSAVGEPSRLAEASKQLEGATAASGPH